MKATLELYGPGGARVRVTPNGADCAHFARLGYSAVPTDRAGLDNDTRATAVTHSQEEGAPESTQDTLPPQPIRGGRRRR